MNPTDNKVIGKVTMADEIDTRKAIGAAKEAFNTFSQSSKEYRMELLQRLHDAVATLPVEGSAPTIFAPSAANVIVCAALATAKLWFTLVAAV